MVNRYYHPPKTLNEPQNTCVLNAEEKFVPHLKKLHQAFPKLRIVLEHATTRAAVEAVKSLGSMVACTITAHHLAMTVDDWAGQPWNYCKPVAKYPSDREALRDVILEGGYRFASGNVQKCEFPPEFQGIRGFSWDRIRHRTQHNPSLWHHPPIPAPQECTHRRFYCLSLHTC